MEDKRSYNQILSEMGIETIYEDESTVWLEYNGKRIERPMNPKNIWQLVEEEFGIKYSSILK